ncbi:MAG: hypothetical protein OXC63_11550 [Aestuariivita sp.]|nr:hypothetical protein [Aestuariivita sp.]MCY4346882.1 hypothetical protein [Aestuariivita sp.]
MDENNKPFFTRENVSILILIITLIGFFMGLSNEIDEMGTHLSDKIDSLNSDLSDKIDSLNSDLTMRIDQSNASASTAILIKLNQQIVDIQDTLARNNIE